jgi:hypothetical protein
VKIVQQKKIAMKLDSISRLQLQERFLKRKEIIVQKKNKQDKLRPVAWPANEIKIVDKFLYRKELAC